MHYAVYVAVQLRWGRNKYTRNVLLVNNMYVWSIIGVEHHWHSSAITDRPFGISPRKFAVNKAKESCNSGALNGKLLTFQGEVMKPQSLSGRISVSYAIFPRRRLRLVKEDPKLVRETVNSLTIVLIYTYQARQKNASEIRAITGSQRVALFSELQFATEWSKF